jgi:outer membrane protein assembly factor BamB
MLILFILLFLPSLSIKILSEGSEPQEYGLLWSFNTNSTVKCISMSTDGKSIVAASGDKIYFLNGEGKLLWSYTLRYAYEWVLVQVSGNGKYIITLGRNSGLFFADFLILDRDGDILYKVDLNPLDICFRYVSISDEGSITIVNPGFDSLDYYDFPLLPSLKWRYKTDYGDKALISSDGSYIVLLWRRSTGLFSFKEAYQLTLLNKDGEKSWDYEVGIGSWLSSVDEAIYCSFSISADGSRIAFATPEEIRMIDRNRNLITAFKRPIKKPDSISVSISPDGKYMVYTAGNETHYSFLIMNDKGEWQWVAKTPVSHACVSSNADYVVAAYETKVLLFAKMNIYTAKVLEEVRSTVLNVKSKGFSVRDAEDLLSQAEAKFNAGFYKEAIELAEKARSLALDIDQDGVLNEEDFAPYTHNSLITMGAAGLVITLILACYAYARSRRGEVYVFDKETGELTVIR